MLDPDFLLLDEPAAGLSNDEIARLAELIKAMHKGVVSAYLGG
jgi:branched-chain amino acid transport system permease protein